MAINFSFSLLIGVSIALFLFIAFPHPSSADDTVSIVLSWKGGTASCSISNCSTGEYASDFACSDGNGDWNGGFVYFMDPIPSGNGNVLHNVSATSIGWYGNTSGILATLFLSGHILSDSLLPVDNTTLCPHCVSQAYYSSDYYPNGMPGYTYGQSNVTLQIATINAFPVTCWSSISLKMSYGPTHYVVRKIDPISGPRNGGTSVTIIGDHFDEAPQPLCSFDGYITQGTMINSTAISCLSPLSTCASFPCEVFVEISEAYLGFTHNRVKFTYTNSNSKSNGERDLLFGVLLGVGLTFIVVLIGVALFIFYQRRKAKMQAAGEQARLIK